jgi:malonate decarboxylase delta subunit
MEHLTFDYPAQRAVTTRAHVGVVGSGDLEVLLSPADAADPAATLSAHVVVRTSVDGYSHIWKSVLDRFFTRYDGAAQIEINDFGATPGVVALRLAEAVEAAEEGDDA